MSSIVEENIKSYIPDGWREVKLKDVCKKISDGIHTTPKYVDKSEYFFINGNNLRNNIIEIDKNTKCVSEEEFLKHKKQLGSNTILLSINGTIGNSAFYNKENVILGKSAAYINCSKTVNIKFLYNLLNTSKIKTYFKNELTGSTIKNLSLKSIQETKLYIPTELKEQKAIADILSGADEVIEATKEKIDLIKLRKKSLMQKLLSPKSHWVEKELGNICKITMGQSPLSEFYNEEKIGLPLIQGNTDIKNRLTKPRFWTSEITKKCYPEDILMSVRAPVGEIAISRHEACIGRGICAISPNKNKAIQSFIYQFLVNYELFWATYSQGSTFTAVNSNDIRKLKIFIPPTTEEQGQIASVLSTCDEEIKLYNQKLKLLERQKTGLMQKLLTGKWRVKINKGAD